MNLENLGVKEVNIIESKSINGGIWYDYIYDLLIDYVDENGFCGPK